MNRTVLQNSVEVLKIVYMVVAGLAVAVGLERFVPGDSGPLQIGLATLTTWSFWFFVIFVTTVARFVHGAIRHFDQSYVEEPKRVNWKIGQPIWDFLGLGFEAFVFFLLAFSIDVHTRFIQYYLVLLIVDCVWLGIIYRSRIWTDHKWWIVANSIVLFPVIGLTRGSIFWLSSHGIEPYLPQLIWVFIGTVAAHTIMDYPLNWEFYFGRPLRSKQKGKTSDTSDNLY